jgi:hypothetical protein
VLDALHTKVQEQPSSIMPFLLNQWRKIILLVSAHTEKVGEGESKIKKMKRKRKRKSVAKVVFFKLMADNTLIRLKDSFQCWQSQQLFSFFLFCPPRPHIWGGRKMGKRVKYNFVFVTPHQHSTPSFFLAQQILRVVFFFYNEDIYFCLGVH